jgi:hypothetical protein
MLIGRKRQGHNTGVEKKEHAEKVNEVAINRNRTDPLLSLLVRKLVEPPPKNRQGIGTSTYIRANICITTDSKLRKEI